MSGFVELRQVKKIYHMGEVAIPAVDGVDFEIQRGEFVVIVGPSGAGKTTVLNILGGMDTSTEGTVLVDGEDISNYRGKKLTAYRRDEIGFVFQFYNLVQNLTALENVELALQISKDPLDAADVLREVGLESSSGWLLPGLWPRTPSFCSAMSPREPWITIRENLFLSFCRIPAEKRE